MKLVHASGTENRLTKGGEEGDQTSKEVCVTDWFDGGWTCVGRTTDLDVINEMVYMACQCAFNDNIGYDQDSGNTLYNEIIKYNMAHPTDKWNFSKITTPCETDCSSFVSTVYTGAFNKVYDKDTFSTQCTTTTLQDYLTKFTWSTDRKYLTSSTYLEKGDLLLRKNGSNGHIAIVVGDEIPEGIEVNETQNSEISYSGTFFYVENPTTDKERVWNSLNQHFSQLGATNPAYVAAGIMGNIMAEAYEDCRCNCAQNRNSESYTSAVNNRTKSKSTFVTDGVGYGLCQWTYYSRKQGLYEYCEAHTTPFDISNCDAQVGFMLFEVEGYGMIPTLCSMDNIRDVSDYFCGVFERPKSWLDGGQSKANCLQKRYDYAISAYEELTGKSIWGNSSVMIPEEIQGMLNDLGYKKFISEDELKEYSEDFFKIYKNLLNNNLILEISEESPILETQIEVYKSMYESLIQHQAIVEIEVEL